jgi:hypothetical protein
LPTCCNVGSMEETNILPKRVRRLAIATGIASALALFPTLFLLYPTLLILGGIIQPRFPSTGRWFLWTGAAMLGAELLLYDVMILQNAFSSGPYTSTPILMLITFPPATILFAWCCAELVADGIRRIRFWRSAPPAEPRPVSWGIGGFLSWYHDRSDVHLDANGRVGVAMSALLLAIVLAFDASLVKRALSASQV